MLAKVIIENGQKKIQGLTADTGVGAPVGSYLYLEKKSNPQGYLYCDGSTFDETAYPALYQYLGTNVLPDWRELGAKGAEKNTTLIFDSTETDPSTGQAGTQNHDVFTQGEFKDDQLQNHEHLLESYGYTFPETSNNAPGGASRGFILEGQGDDSTFYVSNARKGNVTRGKSRAVFIYIKATSGLTENQQENVLNTINENNSYSTEEHPTGAKWIDGKPIYRKVFKFTTQCNQTTEFSLPYANNLIQCYLCTPENAYLSCSPYVYPVNTRGQSNFAIKCTWCNDTAWQSSEGFLIAEYTKTTD